MEGNIPPPPPPPPPTHPPPGPTRREAALLSRIEHPNNKAVIVEYDRAEDFQLDSESLVQFYPIIPDGLSEAREIAMLHPERYLMRRDEFVILGDRQSVILPLAGRDICNHCYADIPKTVTHVCDQPCFICGAFHLGRVSVHQASV